MRLSVLGAGYLGAIHATCMAHIGHEVTVYEIDATKLALLTAGKPPFYEPGFAELLESTLATGRLRFTDSALEAIRGAEMHFICVGTPQQQRAEAADLVYVDLAVRVILDNADCPGIIVGKSTVPVGTAQRIAELASGLVGGPPLAVAWNPEFLREGSAIQDALTPDRLIFGVDSSESEEMLKVVYASILENEVPYITTDLATAEMVKVAANSFLATKISFINAMAEICEVANADVVTLSRALGFDKRIGSAFLNAGLGFGGGCLPKDIRAFSARAGELGASDAVSFLREIDKINLRQRERMVALVGTLLDGVFLGKNIAVLGAAFKPDSDDVRDSPALHVAAAMHVKGASVRIHDPQAIVNAEKMLPTLTYCASIEDACRDADVTILATEWTEYQSMDPSGLAAVVRQPVMVDGRNVLDRRHWANSGWAMYALGRGSIRQAEDLEILDAHDAVLDGARQ